MEENKVNEVAEAAGEAVDVGNASEAMSAEAVNAANAAASTGRVSDDGRAAAFFTAADVRSMTREQVRANLDRILLSMQSDKF